MFFCSQLSFFFDSIGLHLNVCLSVCCILLLLGLLAQAAANTVTDLYLVKLQRDLKKICLASWQSINI